MGKGPGMAHKLCEVCKKRVATVHVTNLIGGKREHHFCEQCAHEVGISTPKPAPNLAEVLSSLIGAQQAPVDEKLAGLSCPRCGMTFKEFRAKGRLGCAYDYEALGKGLMPIVEHIHHGAQHTGKVPSQAGPSVARLSTLIKLRQELQQAVARENYEKAAELRDGIAALEKELDSEDA